MIEFERMNELIDFLRKKGVLVYNTPELSLTLSVEAPEEPISVKDLDNSQEVSKPRKGADGLTAQEQELLYGRVLDGE